MWGYERVSQNVWLCTQFLPSFFSIFHLMEMFYIHLNPSAIYRCVFVSKRTSWAAFLYRAILGGIWRGGKLYENIISLPVFFPESTFVSLLLSLILQTCSNRSLFFPSPSPKLAFSALVPRHQLKTQQGPHTQWALIGLSLSATDNISLSVENKTNCWH